MLLFAGGRRKLLLKSKKSGTGTSTGRTVRFRWVLVYVFGGFVCCGLFRLAAADEWPRWRGPLGDGVWRETGVIETFDSPRIELRWRVPISAGYTGPTVADGRVYVMDRVREPREMERVHCLEWKTGKKIWSHGYDCKYGGVRYQAGPRASVLLEESRAYALGTVGHLHCFDAATGRVLWDKDLNSEHRIQMPDWGIAASPVVEGDLLIVQIGGEDDACIVALNKKTGESVWVKNRPDIVGPDNDFKKAFSTPIAVTDKRGREQLICVGPQWTVSYEPNSGNEIWRCYHGTGYSVFMTVHPPEFDLG